MQSTMPFRWIEEAEARAVITATQCERPLPLSGWRLAWHAAFRRLRRLAAYVPSAQGVPCPMLQSAVIRRAAPFRGRRYLD